MSFRHLLLPFAAAIVIALQLGASCVSDDGGRSDRDRYEERYDDRYDRPRRIPRNADVVREGTGKLKWDADLDGVIYVYDRDEEQVVYTGPVRRGQEIVVHPDDDRVYVQQRVVFDQNLRRDGFHRIYFARERRDDSYDRDRPAGRDDLPRDARPLAQGRGDIAIHEAPRDGRVYIYDETNRRVVYSTEIGRGNSFQIFPDRGYVHLNSRRHASVRFERGHRYALYFSQR